MNLRSFLPGLALLSLCPALCAQPLSRDATVYARPDPAAAVVKVLPSGTVPTPAFAPVEPAPEGWMAVEVPGPHEVYVENKHVGKNLDVKPGSGLRLRPDASAPVVAIMEAGDKTDLAGLAGPRRDWSQYRLEKPIVGYIKLSSAAATLPGAPVAAAVTAVPSGPAVGGEIGRAPMPRFFEGRFTATENFLTYRHPYQFQLLDSAGNRFAYLDVSRLLLTDEPSKYVDHTVVIYGTARTINEKGTKRVIEVESLHLK
jgi:hypothetical protein